MKKLLLIGSVALLLGGCSLSVEHLADEHRQQRLNETIAAHPLAQGAGDGVGGAVPQEDRQLTMR